MSIEPLAPALPRPPRHAPPPGAVDCHTHIFGPYDRFPVQNVMPYAAPYAPIEAHRAMLDAVGVEFGVIVLPGAYGVDPASILHGVRSGLGRARGIGVATSGASDVEIDAWNSAGVRGLRFNDMLAPNGSGPYPGSVGTEHMFALAPRLAERGMHAEIWAPIEKHVANLARYRASGLKISLDHMAGLDVSRGVDDPNFQAILAALREGWLWIKLVLCRASRKFPDYDDVRPFHDALIRANPDRLTWGSDWPHLRLGDQTPDVGALLDIFHDWTPDSNVRRHILAINPARLYRF